MGTTERGCMAARTPTASHYDCTAAMVQCLTLWLGGVVALMLLYLHCTSGSLIASSEVQMCARSSASYEPMFGTGKPCSKKFVVSLAVRNGQVTI